MSISKNIYPCYGSPQPKKSLVSLLWDWALIILMIVFFIAMGHEDASKVPKEDYIKIKDENKALRKILKNSCKSSSFLYQVSQSITDEIKP
jgi:hypothetical protein